MKISKFYSSRLSNLLDLPTRLSIVVKDEVEMLLTEAVDPADHGRVSGQSPLSTDDHC